MKHSKIIQFLIIVAGSAIFLVTTPKTNTSISFIEQSTEQVATVQDLARRITILIFLIPTIFLIKNTIIKNRSNEKRLAIKKYFYLLLKLAGIIVGYCFIWNIVNWTLLCLC